MNNNGMKIFVTIWFGQFASRIGTALTRFALLIWAYEQTTSASTVALLGFFAFVPLIAVSPVAGLWIDRYDRRKIMLLADTGAGVMTLGMLLLYASGNLQIWHLYLAEALAGVFEAFQGPAYVALTTQLLPKEQYARASGLRSVAEDGANVVAPFVAGLVLVWMGVSGVMVVDLLTLLIAVSSLLLVSVPNLVGLHAGDATSGNAPQRRRKFRQEIVVGFRYIWQRPGLLGLMFIFSGLNFIDALTWLSIFPVMILARSGGDEIALASVQAALGAAGVAGGLFVSIWGGPKRKVHAALIGAALSFLLGGVLLAVGHTLWVWIIASCVAMIFVPFIGSSNQAIWQAKVAPPVQGRVLSVYGMVRQSMIPVGMLLGGLLADGCFEPAMMPGGSLTSLFGPVVGTGPGAGMALMFLVSAILGCAMSLSGYLFPAVRHVEDELPDHDIHVASTSVAQPV